MTFVESIASCLSKPITFSGRSTRSEYWWFYLFAVVFCLIIPQVTSFFVFFFPSAYFHASFAAMHGEGELAAQLARQSMDQLRPALITITVTVNIIVTTLIWVPVVAAGSRRLHDTNRSGWWWLLYPTVIGLIPLVIWWAMDSDPKTNRFGPNPK